LVSISSKSQTTYYWKGAPGAALAPSDWQLATNWNTAKDSSGTARTTPTATDTLVFDATATLGTALYVGNIPSQALACLRITGGATVHLMTIVAPTSSGASVASATAYGGCTNNVTGSGFSNLKKGDFVFLTQATNVQVLAIKDDNNMTTSNDNSLAAGGSLFKYTILYPDVLTVDAGTILNMAGSVSGTSFNSLAIISKGGTIRGAVNFTSRASYCKLFCTTPNNGSLSDGIHVLSGGSITYNTSTSGQKNFLLGHTLGLYDGSGNFIYNDGSGANNKIPGYSGNAGIVFESGSTFTNTAGQQFFVMGNSWNANNTDLSFTPGVVFKSGSTYIANGSPVYSPYWPIAQTTGLSFGNLEFRNALPSVSTTVTSCTFNATVENLTIAGTVATSSIAGYLYLKGNITTTSTNAPTLTFANMYMVGTGNHTITPTTGSYVFTNFVVADKAQATLAGNISATNLYLVGKLNFGSFTVTGTGATPNLYTFAGPYIKQTGITGFTKGSNAIGGISGASSFTAAPYTYDFPIGATVSQSTSSALLSETVFRSYGSSGNGVLSTLAQASVDTLLLTTATFSIQGSSFTTNAADLNASAPGFTNYYTNINLSILPVKIGALSALVVGANAVKVSWNVYDEVNIDKYVVESSSNGVSFAAVGTVKAIGNSIYTFIDNNASGAVIYYRVKSIDKSTGAISYSSVVSIALNAIKTASVNVYPNPVVGGELHLQTTNFKSGKLYVMLYNNQGKQMAQQALTYNGGAMAQTLALSNAVKAGTYQLIVTDGVSSITKTIFVVQ
jgi:hypothetical protein